MDGIYLDRVFEQIDIEILNQELENKVNRILEKTDRIIFTLLSLCLKKIPSRIL